MLTKLRYVCVNTEDLLEIYCLFIRSRAEYCSVVFHDSFETIQIVCLKVILQENYISYEVVMEICGLKSLFFKERIQEPGLWQEGIKTSRLYKIFPSK